MKNIFRLILACMLLPLLAACSGDDYVASVTDLRLVSISPNNVYAGDIATILGRNFSVIPSENIVTVAGVKATVIEAEKDQIKIIMPKNVEVGKQTISVSAPSGEVSGLEVTYLKTPLHQYIVQTVVGQKGKNTCIDGFGTDATVGNPTGVNILKDGSIWFTDRKNNKIRCMSTDQIVSTVAAPNAKTVWQGAFDSKGVYYYVDKDLKTVSRINADGSATVVVDGLTGPLSVEFDRNDKMYVAERDGFRITMLTADGKRSSMTVGTKGHGPMHIGFDSKDNMYVTRQSSYCIDMVAADGTITRIAGTGEKATEQNDGEPGNPLSAAIGHVFGFSIGTDGCLYFADSSFHTIRRIVPDADGNLAKGTVETLAGTGKSGYADGKGLQAAFNTPYDVAISDDCTTMYVTDVLNQLIRRITVR